LSLLFGSCIAEQLDDCYLPGGNIYVKIHWGNLVPGGDLPENGMHIQLYPEGDNSFIGFPLGVHGGTVWLPPGVSHLAVCFDYAGMGYVNFRNMHDVSLFEVYKEPVGATYATRVDMGRDEPVVYEPYPYTFYTTQDLPTVIIPEEGTDTLHCHPTNVLHEFTYLVHGVEGIENVASSRGTVSGMSASYRLMSGELSGQPSTVLFLRSLALENGRSPEEFEWNVADTLQRVPVANFGSIPVSPKWFPAGWDNPETGWKGDWVIGAFAVFGLASPGEISSQLTVECFSHADYHHYASWGYWKGNWDDTVTTQMLGALGYWDDCPEQIEKGSPEAQTLWRKRNGGFDIILANEGRLEIPPDVGIEAPVSGWDGVVVPLE
jgi:hypothetical protein